MKLSNMLLSVGVSSTSSALSSLSQQQQQQPQVPPHQLPFDCHNHIHLGSFNDHHPSTVPPSEEDTSVVCQEPPPPAAQLASDAPYDDNNDDHPYPSADDNDNKESWKIQPSPREGMEELLQQIIMNGSTSSSSTTYGYSGMAIMSTHPRDYDTIQYLSSYSSTTNGDDDGRGRHCRHGCFPIIVPCFGIHPWFIHELQESDWQVVVVVPTHPDIHPIITTTTTTTTTIPTTTTTTTGTPVLSTHRPQWVTQLEQRLIQNPNAIIGEIGLDRFHFTTATAATSSTSSSSLSSPPLSSSSYGRQQKQLCTTMSLQIQVFQYQWELAVQYQRPICVHCVHAMGILLDLLTYYSSNGGGGSNHHNNNNHHQKKQNKKQNAMILPLSSRPQLPPKIYFHAFSGKLGTVQQILSLCASKNKNHPPTSCPCYFGFAPIVNFRSHRTPDIIRAIGLHRLLLETDVEQIQLVPSHLQIGVQYIAQVLQLDETTVMEQTTRNAKEFYNLTF
jgi:Tat protein secretion system quality control protein TatD with DNase activity